MKKSILFLLLIIVGSSSKTQIDLSTDVSFHGVYQNAKVSYPIYDRLILGGSLGYNLTSNFLKERIDAVIGIKFDEWGQLELDLGAIGGYNKPGQDTNQSNKKHYVFHADIGLKLHFLNNMFCSIQLAYPGFFKFGLGVRLRPYNKLTIWDKQG